MPWPLSPQPEPLPDCPRVLEPQSCPMGVGDRRRDWTNVSPWPLSPHLLRSPPQVPWGLGTVKGTGRTSLLDLCPLTSSGPIGLGDLRGDRLNVSTWSLSSLFCTFHWPFREGKQYVNHLSHERKSNFNFYNCFGILTPYLSHLLKSRLW